MKYLLLSDIHLSLFKNNDSIIDFLKNKTSEFDKIFFLGDTFDFYFPFKHFIPSTYFNFFRIVSELAETKEIYFMPGNHDIWLDEFFVKTLKTNIICGPYTLKFNNKRICLMHGDNLFYDSLKNRIVKWILTNKIDIFLFSMLHPEIGYRIGHFITSFFATKKHKMNLIYEAIDKILKNDFYEQFDYIVLGHIHKPYYSEQHSIVFIGDFLNHKSYCIIDEQGVRIEYF